MSTSPKVPVAQLINNSFLDELNFKYGFSKSIDCKVIDALCNYDWPGNVRELKNIIERIILMSNLDIIGINDLPVKFEAETHRPELEILDDRIDLNLLILKYEMNLINWAYDKYNNVRDAAKFLGIHPSTFVRKRQRGNKTQP